MTTRAKREWFQTLALAAALLAGGVLWSLGAGTAHADGGSWDTDGILVNTTETDRDRYVLVDTQKQRILVYKVGGAGQFRLATARCYKYDLEIGDSSKSEDIEKKGGVNYPWVYEKYHTKKQ